MQPKSGIKKILRPCAVLALAAAGLSASDPAIGLTPAGRWRTVDDKTGQPRSVVVIWEENGPYFGRVE